MKHITRVTITVASLLLAGPALAQDAASNADDTPKTEEEFPVAKQPADGPYVKDKFGTWEVRCIKSETQEDCSLYHLLKDDTGNPTAEITIFALPEGQEAKAGVTFVSPLGTLLTRGIAYSIDSDRPRRYNFNWCERNGCVARFGFSDEEIEFMKQGKKGTFTIVALAAPNNPLALTLPLEGFTAGWNALEDS